MVMRKYNTIFLPNNLCDGEGIYKGRFSGDTIPDYVLENGLQTMDLPDIKPFYVIKPDGIVRYKHGNDFAGFVTVTDLPSRINIYTSVRSKDPNYLGTGWEYWEFEVHFFDGRLNSVNVVNAPHPDHKIFAHSETTTLSNDKVEIELELPNDLLLKLALQAHDKDITLNQHIVNILEEAMKNGKNI
jgi:hypothetical protein